MSNLDLICLYSCATVLVTHLSLYFVCSILELPSCLNLSVCLSSASAVSLRPLHPQDALLAHETYDNVPWFHHVSPSFTQAVQRCSKNTKEYIRPRRHATAGTQTMLKVEQTSSNLIQIHAFNRSVPVCHMKHNDIAHIWPILKIRILGHIDPWWFL